MIKGIVATVVVMVFLSCEKMRYQEVNYEAEVAETSPLVKENLDKRIRKYKNIQLEKCKKDAMIEAIKYVDSIIVEELNLIHLDNTNFPNRPVRPRLPENVILNDSTAIKPI